MYKKSQHCTGRPQVSYTDSSSQQTKQTNPQPQQTEEAFCQREIGFGRAKLSVSLQAYVYIICAITLAGFVAWGASGSRSNIQWPGSGPLSLLFQLSAKSSSATAPTPDDSSGDCGSSGEECTDGLAPSAASSPSPSASPSYSPTAYPCPTGYYWQWVSGEEGECVPSASPTPSSSPSPSPSPSPSYYPCPTGYHWEYINGYEGQCVPNANATPSPSPSGSPTPYPCPSGSHWEWVSGQEGQCVPNATPTPTSCPPGYYWEGSGCRPNSDRCPAGQQWDEITQSCQPEGPCPSGYHWDEQWQSCQNDEPCPPGQHWEGGPGTTSSPHCVDNCPPGQHWDEATQSCQPDTPCPEGEQWNPITQSCTRTHCLSNEDWDEETQTCQPRTCPPGQHWGYIPGVTGAEGQCIPDEGCPVGARWDEITQSCQPCPEGEYWDGDSCRPHEPPPCEAGAHWDIDTQSCQPDDPCAPGMRWDADEQTCIACDAAWCCAEGEHFDADMGYCTACPAGQSWNGEACVPDQEPCPEGQHWNGDWCVPDEPEPCPEGQVRDPETGECVPVEPPHCPEGQVWNGDWCVPDEPEPCPQGQHWNGDWCVNDEPPPCPQGQHRDAQTGECVPDGPPTSPFAIELTTSAPDFIVYRGPQNQDAVDAPETPSVTANPRPEYEEGNPMVEDNLPSGEEVEPVDQEINDFSENHEEPEGWELQGDEPLTVIPAADESVEHPVIRFGVRIRGYQSWEATVRVYAIAEGNGILSTPLATLTTSETDVTWDDLFPGEKPDSGVYFYNIELQGNFDENTSLAPERVEGLEGEGKESQRLNKKVFVRDLQIEELTGAPESADADKLRWRINLKFQDAAGQAVDMESAFVTPVKPELTPGQSIVLEEENGWWVGTWTLEHDSVGEFGDWQLVAGGKVNAVGNGRTAVSAKKMSIQKPELTGVALGFVARNEANTSEVSIPNRTLMEGHRITFRAFLRIKTSTGIGWYSDQAVANLSNYQWIGAGATATGAIASRPANVRKIAAAWLKDTSLNPRVVWRLFDNIVTQQSAYGNGNRRWYGFKPRERHSEAGFTNGLSFTWNLSRGTNWWGGIVLWKKRIVITAPKKAPQTRMDHMKYFMPTDRVNGTQVVRVNGANSEYHGANLRSGNARYARLTYLDNPDPPRLWAPDPYSENPNAVTAWNGRISGKADWQLEEFAANDTFFTKDGTRERPPSEVQQLIARQRPFQTRIMQEAYAFLNVPYSWGGQTYGGWQSSVYREFTSTHDTNLGDGITYERGDPHGSIGDSQHANRVGYGIDCNGLIGEVARICGRGNGDMRASDLKSNSLSKAVADQYLRQGDYVAWGTHTFYFRDRPTLKTVNGRQVIDQALTIEAKPNTVSLGSYSGDELRNAQAKYRRWEAP